jgi:DNA-binding LacI/PurR family transcriptional regulator
MSAPPSLSLHDRIRAWLIGRIQTMAPGSLLPTEVAVAKRFGASRLTTHKVLAELQRDGVVRRVKGKGTFVEPRPGHIQGTAVPARNGRVVLAYPQWFSYDIWSKIDRATLIARELQFEPIEHHVTPASGIAGLQTLIAAVGEVCGIIYIPPGAVVAVAELQQLDALGVPVIILVPVADLTRTTRITSLSKDCLAAGRLMVGALTRHGHRRIGYVANEPWSASSDLTYAGLKQGMYAAGLQLRDLQRSSRDVQPWENSMVAGRALTTELLGREPAITAVIYDSVPGVIGGLAAITDAGRRVPADLSVVVNDSYADFEAQLGPGITSVDVDRAALMRRALTSLTGPTTAASDRILIEPVSVHERASIAATPT